MKKIIISVLFIVIIMSGVHINAQGTVTYFVDPVAGVDANSGTIDNPVKTIAKALSLLGTKIGTIYLRGGTYGSAAKIKLGNSGAEGNYICIWAYQNEKVRFDFTGNTSDGFSISGKYYYLKGIEASFAGHNGFNISGDNNRIEHCIASYNKNTGLHITGGSGSPPPGPSGNLIINCDAYFNFDPPIGGNADGFSAKWTVGPGNVFKGCRAYNNSDDGWDLWMCTSTIVIDSCVAFRNGVDTWFTGQVSGNGNGFKLGGNSVSVPHIVRSCVSFDNDGNTGRGFDENNNYAGQTLYNCIGFRNKKSNFYLNNNPLVSGMHDIKNCISFLPGQADAIRNAVLEHNSWQGYTVTADDFISIDTTGVTAERDTSGQFNSSVFLHLAMGSDMIDSGVYVGIPYAGKAPDLGPFETEEVVLHMPSIPLAVFPSDITFNGFSANWNKSDAATGYYIQLATDSNFSQIISRYDMKDLGDVTTFPVNGLDGLTTYFYRIIAYNQDGESTPSNSITVTTLIDPPTAPLDLEASQVSSVGFTANWSASATATGYLLEIAYDSTFISPVAGFTPLDAKNVVSVVVTGLNSNMDYYYRVSAYNAGGTGLPGNKVHVKTDPATGIDRALKDDFRIKSLPGKINIASGNQIQKIEVLDLLGRIMVTIENPGLEFNIDTNNWKSGVYLLVIFSDRNFELRKILVK